MFGLQKLDSLDTAEIKLVNHDIFYYGIDLDIQVTFLDTSNNI